MKLETLDMVDAINHQIDRAQSSVDCQRNDFQWAIRGLVNAKLPNLPLALVKKLLYSENPASRPTMDEFLQINTSAIHLSGQLDPVVVYHFRGQMFMFTGDGIKLLNCERITILVDQDNAT